MNSRLSQAIHKLARKGIEVSSISKVEGGINSAVYHIRDKNDTEYALKLYQLPGNGDARNRCLTEVNFLKYTKSLNLETTPILHSSDIQNGWSLLSWIKGERLNKINDQSLMQITSFISDINKTNLFQKKPRLQFASESCRSTHSISQSINRRIMYIQNNCPSYSLKEDVIEWVEQILQPDYEQINCKLIKRIKNLSHWNDIHTNQIVSPSDVGIHNTLANNHCLYFIDFEYAGLDDLSKFAADWVLQPKYIFNKNEESKLIQYLCKYFYSKIRDSWVERYYDIKPLIALKWCLIMLNSARNGTLTQKQFNMMKSYYQATKRLDN